jgi:hypothetical protein
MKVLDRSRPRRCRQVRRRDFGRLGWFLGVNLAGRGFRLAFLESVSSFGDSEFHIDFLLFEIPDASIREQKEERESTQALPEMRVVRHQLLDLLFDHMMQEISH